MNRLLLPSPAFTRASRRYLKKHPEHASVLRATLLQLSEDAYHPTLHTHKLTGDLAGKMACSAGYDLRILFAFIQHDGAEAIQLLTVGTHDEVY